MPKSKKPRKKGMSKAGRAAHLMKRIARGQFDSPEQMDRLITQYERQQKEDRRKCEQLGWMLTFTDKQPLLEAFAHSFYSIDRWPTTTDYDDFNRVSSSLMLGALLHKAMGVQEEDLFKDIQHAAFMTVVCARLRNHKKAVPPSNLEPIKHGLIISQELMEYAYENDRQVLIDVLKHNSRDNVNNTPGLLEKHERFLLGDRYELVAKWEDEDEPTQNLKDNNGTNI